MTVDRSVQPESTAARASSASLVTPERPAGRSAACGSWTCRRAGRRRWPPAADEVARRCRWPAAATVSCDDETCDARRPRRRCSPASPTSPTCPATPGRWCPQWTAGGSRCPSARAYAAAAVPLRRRRRRRRSSCAAPGQASRQVEQLLHRPRRSTADRLIAVEVLTPGGNWSSYPPHKHDEQRDGRDRTGGDLLLRDGDRTVVALPARLRPPRTGRIDVCAEVRTGDVVLIPYGWHGPSMAAPGYDLYYLNVMAGPGERRVAASRRPGPRVDPRHLGRPGRSIPACP